MLELCQKVAATPARGVGGGVGQSRDVPGGAKCAMQTIRYREELLNNWEPPTRTEINRRILGEVRTQIAKE